MIYVDPSGHFDIQMYPEYGGDGGDGGVMEGITIINGEGYANLSFDSSEIVAPNNQGSIDSGSGSNANAVPGSNNEQGDGNQIKKKDKVGPENSVAGKVTDIVTAKAGVYNSVLTGEARELQKHGNFKIDGRDKIYKMKFYGNGSAVTSAEVVKNAKAAQASLAKFGTWVSRGTIGISTFLVFKEGYDGGFSDQAIAKMVVSGGVTAIGAIGPVGAGISFGLTLMNNAGMFESFYNKFDDKRRLTK